MAESMETKIARIEVRVDAQSKQIDAQAKQIETLVTEIKELVVVMSRGRGAFGAAMTMAAGVGIVAGLVISWLKGG
jgi:ABC-type xylose transport system substrate-binding protein